MFTGNLLPVKLHVIISESVKERKPCHVISRTAITDRLPTKMGRGFPESLFIVEILFLKKDFFFLFSGVQLKNRGLVF